jgi:hypothetical protein
MVFADASYTPDQNLDMLVRTVRILQVGMGLQLSENADLTEEYNKMQDDLAVRKSPSQSFVNNYVFYEFRHNGLELATECLSMLLK